LKLLELFVENIEILGNLITKDTPLLGLSLFVVLVGVIITNNFHQGLFVSLEVFWF